MLKLEKAICEDGKAITEIKKAAFNDETRNFGPGTDGGPPGYDSVEDTIEGIKSNIYYRITLNDKTIGSFWLHKINDAHFELEDFVIHPDYQNKGYGKEGLILMEKKHPEIKTWSLGTPHYSTKNQYLYKKMGYKQTGKSDDNFLILYEKKV